MISSTRISTALYLHVPFCKKICPFCSFAVRKDKQSQHIPYLEGMVSEMCKRAESLQNANSNKSTLYLSSIYFGGGTPSRLTIPEIDFVIKGISKYFLWDEKSEIAFEMNPEDVNPEFLEDLQSIGINRVSLGGQSFQDSTLTQLGRIHDSQQLRHAAKTLAGSSLHNWNLDLMFGVPGQSFSSFQKDILEALAYEPSHVSLYGLEIHQNTLFGHKPEIKEWAANHLEQFEMMYLWAIEQMSQAGLLQYEVSNFAKKGFQGRNNLLVWDGEPYLGLGVGAHSFWKNERWGNVRSIRSYLKMLDNNTWPVEFKERLTLQQNAAEKLMLDLRQPKGINLEKWIKIFNIKWHKHQDQFISHLCKEKRALWKGENLCLTPKGMLLADAITAQLMPEE